MRITRATLQVDEDFQRFVEDELLPAAKIDATTFWSALAGLVTDFGPENARLLKFRDELQDQIDTWLTTNDALEDPDGYRAFLESIGYLVPEPAPQPITVGLTDAEIGSTPGPQLVVPVTNARYAINAANARWGSLYDALYGTDALGTAAPGAYDPNHGARVITWARDFLDANVPLAAGSYRNVTGFSIADGALIAHLSDGSSTSLANPDQFTGYQGEPASPTRLVLHHHHLGIQIVLDREHSIGASDAAGIADVVIESAVSTIVDLEDSVACVDTEDKILAYRNWLGLMLGTLTAEVHKATTFTRRMADDHIVISRDGEQITLPGRSLLLVRNVGLHMYTDVVLDADGNPIPEGILDLLIAVTAALPNVQGRTALQNSKTSSIYVVKPKMHGPEEVAFFVQQCDRVEEALGLPRGTIKIGLMDEERRTSANLAACIAAASSRIAFINTGFLDRTGDEIHTAMAAGPVVGKAAMRSQPWILAYEDRNVDLGLAFGFQGKAQIGKGMWAAPNQMAEMLKQKSAHPNAGANCAWVPSPTAATLHATHYHHIDVRARQEEIRQQGLRGSREDLLIMPIATTRPSDAEIQAELDNAAQGILGYVVRWVNQGVGCSTVPDINNVGLMEDRATLRISSQLLANWLRHGWISRADIEQSFARMIPVVNQQNSSDPEYQPLGNAAHDEALAAAWDLILTGAAQSNGYTEPVLHERRRAVKEASTTGGHQ